MDERKIHISEVIEISEKFHKGELTQEELEKWGSEINIRLYLPMLEKYDAMAKILLKINFIEHDSTEIKIIEMEMQKFWQGLLRYTNIEIPYEEMDMYCTLINYDIVYPIIGEWIKQYCRVDYITLEKMIDENLNFFNIMGTISTLEAINPESIKKANKELKATLKGLEENKELIHDLSEVMVYNNPYTQQIVENMKTIAVENAKEKK